jgi:hypothetical protein
MPYVFLLMQLVMLDHMFLAYPIGTSIISKGKSLSANKLRCILRHSECSAQLIKLDDISNCRTSLSFFPLYVANAFSSYPRDEHFSNLSTHSVGAPSSSLCWEVEGTSILICTVEIWRSEGYG